MSRSINIDEIIRKAVEKNASDIHIVVGSPIVFRIYGSLYDQEGAVIEKSDVEQIIKSICRSELLLNRLEKEKDADFSYEVDGTRLRANAHVTKGCYAISLRLIQKNILSSDELGLLPIVKTLAYRTKGLILVTGPTGSGKSTTQAALIKHICETRSAHIISIEDPVEYDFSTIEKKPGTIIEQREVGEDTPSFNSALKHVLRQDPDVILIGEIRDHETISTALTAAETGHLVITTLHTQDTTQSIDRIIDVFPPEQQQQIRIQLSMTLEAILSQHLFTKVDKSGSAVAMEVLLAKPSVRNLIRSMKTQEIYSLIEIGKDEGMQTLEESLNYLVNKGQISSKDAAPFQLQFKKLKKAS